MSRDRGNVPRTKDVFELEDGGGNITGTPCEELRRPPRMPRRPVLKTFEQLSEAD